MKNFYLFMLFSTLLLLMVFGFNSINWDITSKILTSIASIVLVVTPFIGLDQWKNQVKGKIDYELARRYMKAVYRTRDALKYVRGPFVSIEETISALEKSGLNKEDYSDNKKSNRAVYSLRWVKVIEASSDLSQELLEAQVSWGPKALEIENDFDGCIKKLYSSLVMFLKGYELTGQRDIIYDMGDEDEFNKEIDRAIKKIEDYLRPHLK